MNSKNRQGYAVGMNTSHRISGKHNKGSFLTESTVSPGKVPRLCLPCDTSAIRPLSACVSMIDRTGKKTSQCLGPKMTQITSTHNSFAIINRMALPNVKEAEKGTY